MDTTTITIIISIGALLVAFMGLLLNSRKESRNVAASLAEIKAGQNTLISGINDIRVEIRSLRDLSRELTERVAKAEAEIDLLKRHTHLSD